SDAADGYVDPATLLPPRAPVAPPPPPPTAAQGPVVAGTPAVPVSGIAGTDGATAVAVPSGKVTPVPSGAASPAARASLAADLEPPARAATDPAPVLDVRA